MKICNICKRTLPLTDFNKKKSNPDGHQGQCRECSKEKNKSHYGRNKQSYLDRNDKNRKIRRSKWIEFKRTLKCERCGENHPATLDFHHLDPNEKDFNLSGKAFYGYSVERIHEELSKCIILCSNCHRKEHYSGMV